MKKLLSVFCIATVILTATGCSSDGSSSEDTAATTTTAAETTTTTAATTAETTTTSAALDSSVTSTADSTADSGADGTVSETADVSGSITADKTTSENPAPLNQWVDFTLYSPVDKTYHKVNVRVTNVKTQSQDADYVNQAVELNNSCGSDYSQIDISELEIPDDCELGVIDYEVNVPADFPTSDYGIIAPDIDDLGVANVGGGGIPTGDGTGTYIGLSSNKEELLLEKDPKYKVGATYKFRYLFLIVKGYEDYCFSASSYNDGTVELSADVNYHAYFAKD